MRVCLVGATHPSLNPRLVREADTLTEAGHQVRVVAPHFVDWADERERRLMQERKWRLQHVDFRAVGWKRFRNTVVRTRSHIARLMAGRLKRQGWASLAYGLAVPELTRLAVREPADWFIAHGQAVLPVAARAAEVWNAHLGFDCEDLLTQAPGEPAELVRVIESLFVPKCDYVSTASRFMAEQLAGHYSISNLCVLHNVFPLRMAERLLRPKQRPARRSLRLHWFGQTIGAGRGLEEAVETLALLPPGTELHLRGVPVPRFLTMLGARAAELGVASQLKVLPVVDHDQLIDTLGEFDVGLALERPDNGNASITVSNKLFSYLLGGLAVAATRTTGQRDILDRFPGSGFLYDAGDVRALAEGLMAWACDQSKLRAAQETAWEAARTSFCWDLEKRTFLSMFASRPQPEPAAVSAGR